MQRYPVVVLLALLYSSVVVVWSMTGRLVLLGIVMRSALVPQARGGLINYTAIRYCKSASELSTFCQ